MHRQAALPAAGAWDMSVRWTPGPGRTARAAYQVASTAGVKTVFVKTALRDLRQGWGQWHRLGRFRFDFPSVASGIRPSAPVPTPPPVEGGVTLLPVASAHGVVVAGKVRFVGPFL